MKDNTSTIERMKSMMRSGFAYDSLSKDNSYIVEYKEKLGVELFNEVYDEHEKYLNDTFTVERNVGSDSEGNSYNSLVEK